MVMMTLLFGIGRPAQEIVPSYINPCTHQKRLRRPPSIICIVGKQNKW